MQSTVVTYAYDPTDGGLRELGTISTLPDGYSGPSDAAEIVLHPSGKFLYASNRGHDSIAVFSIAPATGTLTRVEIVPVLGKTPRNFALDPTGSWLLGGQSGFDNLVIFRINRNTGRLTATGQVLQVPSPVCVKFVPLPLTGRSAAGQIARRRDLNPSLRCTKPYRSYRNANCGGSQYLVFQAQTLDEAVHVLAESGGQILSGGTDFFPALGDRPAPDRVLDISGLDRNQRHRG